MASVRGVASLLAKIEALGGNSKRALKVGVHQATKKVQVDAKRLAPVADGMLRNSIKGETEERGGKIIGKVSTNVHYAPYVEFGTGQRGENSPSPPKYPGGLAYRQDWTGMVAQPYLYPAAQQNKEEVVKIVKKELRAEIRRLGGR